MRALVGVAFLWVLSTRASLEELVSVAKAVDFSWLSLSFATLTVIVPLVSLRLQIMMAPMGMRISLGRLIEIELSSRFYALLLPASIGRPLARWYRITENKTGRLDFAVVSVMEKVLGVLSISLFVVLPLWVTSDDASIGLRAVLLPVAAIATFLAGGLLVVTNWGGGRWLGRSGIGPRGGGRFRAGLSAAASLYRNRARVLLLGLALTALIHLANLFRIGLLMYAVGVALSPLTIIWVGSAVLALTTLPVSLAGVGVRESAFAYVVSLYGFAIEQGAMVGSLFFAQIVFLALLGALLEVVRPAGRSAR